MNPSSGLIDPVLPKVKDKTPKPRVLIVDDDTSTMEAISRAIAPSFDFLLASNTVSALGIMKRLRIGLVISGGSSEGCSTASLLKGMKRDPRLSSIPLLALMEDGDESLITSLLVSGASDVIRKPFLPIIVLARVKDLILIQNSAEIMAANQKNVIKMALQSEAIEKAKHDELTGLYARLAFFKELRSFLDTHSDKQYELIYFDIDHFSLVNERWGSQTGDHFLKTIGEGIANIGDWAGKPPLVSRLEADHFVALHDPRGFTPYEILQKVEEWMGVKLPHYSVKIRIGIYPIGDKLLEPSLMCDRALIALRSTKGDFTKRVGFYDQMLKGKLLEEQELLDEMMPALEKGRFVVFFQPQVEYPSNRIVGSEALVRWNHERKGMLQPGVFLPLFEKNNLITKLDDFVWESTCRQLSVWIKEYGVKNVYPVSVNISRADALMEDLVGRLKSLTVNYGVPTSLLHLEITESAYVEDAQKLSSIVSALTEEGFLVEMDDFGSGYSSLNALKDIRVGLLKLDMKFLSSGGDATRSGNILSSIVRMARWLSLPVMAEGVETKEQADYLSSIGCHMMQGYYFSKPLPKADYEKFCLSGVRPIPQLSSPSTYSMAEQFWKASNQTALIFNSDVGGTVIVERSGDNLEMLRGNEEFFRLMNISSAAYAPLMLNVWSRFDDKNREIYKKMLDEASNNGMESSCEIASLPLNGDEVIYTKNRAKLLAKSDDSEIFYVSVENVSAEKKAKQELIEQKETFSRLYNELPCGIIDYNAWADGSFVVDSFNDSAYLLSGFKSREEYLKAIKKNNGTPLVHSSDVSTLVGEAKKAIRNSSMEISEVQIAREDCSWFWAEVRMRGTKKGDGSSHLQATFTDITDRKNRETERYGRIFFSLFQKVYLFDFENDYGQPINSDGQREEVFLGLTEAMKEWQRKYIAPSFYEAFVDFEKLENLRKNSSNGNIPTIRYDCFYEGKTIHLESLAFPIDSFRFLFCVRDITEETNKKETEEQIAILKATLRE